MPASNEFHRPDPESLLAGIARHERQARRGRLRIYFGASAGTGKTCAMLNAAHKLVSDGQKVLVGLVETHARKDTIALLDGLTLLPRKSLVRLADDPGNSRTAEEFDIDAALKTDAGVILIDELAHSNAAGSRHPKRWQDVEEMLDAGFDVYTTVNVQHLESLNDVVGGITGVAVSETLPDTVFDTADEVILVDISAEELLERLSTGKIYAPAQAETAARHFFRKGNLMALRELALRRTADRIKDDVSAYRTEKFISQVWKTDSLLLACIGPDEFALQFVRNTARLASQSGSAWHAIYVETPALQKLPVTQRDQILRTMKLARDLGAVTAIVAGNNVAGSIVDYTRDHGIAKVVIGRPARPRFWRTPLASRLVSIAPDLDVIALARAQSGARAALADSMPGHTGAGGSGLSDSAYPVPVKNALRHVRYVRYIGAVAATLLTSLVAMPLLSYLDLANIVMLFLMTVVLVSAKMGRGPAIVSTLLGVASFDFFFVSPRFSFAVSDFQYLVTFFVMLLVGLLISHLTAGLRYQARVASHRERRAHALYEYARALSGALQQQTVVEIAADHMQRTFRSHVSLLLPDAQGRLQDVTPAERPAGVPEPDWGIAQWAYDRTCVAGIGTDTLPANAYFYLPLAAPMRTRGMVLLRPTPDHTRWLHIPEQRQQLDTFAALTAIALERVHYIEVAQHALLHMESERLRNSLLSALSHDLRTPLTVLVGLSESLLRSRPALSEAQTSLATALHDDALRMTRLADNLLDMARIETGDVKLRCDWQSVEEMVGSAIRASKLFTASHVIVTHIGPDLPLLFIDMVLIERVLANLIENAVKYTPPGSRIDIAAEVRQNCMTVIVSDNGPGLPPGKEELIFEKFVRGTKEQTQTGVGLGLAICRAIAEAHGGTIHARNLAGEHSGACFELSFPLPAPPDTTALEQDLSQMTQEPPL